jgi:hypothetical protein
MKELKEIVVELKVVNAKAKELRKRQKELQTGIIEWLVATDRPGVMYEDLVVLRKEGATHARMKKKEKQEAAIGVLEEHGIQDAETLYESLRMAMVGEEQKVVKLNVKLAKG